jgi:uncharacterized protein (TIGR02996 family)
MPDRETFQRMIADNPDDDGPRLVYADWLEEQGDTAEAEYIRVQCQRNRLPADDQEGRARLTAQVEDTEKRLAGEWKARLPRFPGVTWGPFHRGAVEMVLIDRAEPLLQHGEAIFAAVPVRLLWFKNLGADGAQAVAESPLMARVTELNVASNQIGDDGIAALAASPRVANLRKLYASGNGITADGAAHIAGSKYLKNLVLLFLHANQIGDSGAESLATSKRLVKVVEIFLAANNLHDVGIAALRRRWGDRAYV